MVVLHSYTYCVLKTNATNEIYTLAILLKFSYLFLILGTIAWEAEVRVAVVAVVVITWP